MITGIVVALPEELSTLTAQKITKGRCAFMGDAVMVALAGTGGGNARAAAALLVAQGATQLISWGCAAALNADLKPGDLVLATTLVNAGGLNAEGLREAGFEVDGQWQSHCQTVLADILRVHTGLLATSNQLAATGPDKKRINAETGACALDMESAAIAAVAKQHQLPFIAIRAIADPADMDLPFAIRMAINAEGEVVLAKLLGYLARHPLELSGLVKVGLQFNAARKTLKAVASLLDALIRFDRLATAAI